MLLRLMAAGMVTSACAPLPVAPNVAGPDEGRVEIANDSSATRELVWVTNRGTLRIKASRMCRDGDAPSGSACVRLSATDRAELDRFFGANNFRRRWDTYRPCAALFGDENVAFQVTFADGHSVGKALDRAADMPTIPSCDRATRDTVAVIGSALVDRYFR